MTATKISGALTPQSPTIDYTQDAYGHKLAVSREAGLLCAWLNYKFRDEMLFFVETLPSDADLADTEGQLFVLSDLQSQTCGERTKTGRQLTTKQKEIMQQNITALTTALHGRLNNFDNQLAAQQTLRSA